MRKHRATTATRSHRIYVLLYRITCIRRSDSADLWLVAPRAHPAGSHRFRTIQYITYVHIYIYNILCTRLYERFFFPSFSFPLRFFLLSSLDNTRGSAGRCIYVKETVSFLMRALRRHRPANIIMLYVHTTYMCILLYERGDDVLVIFSSRDHLYCSDVFESVSVSTQIRTDAYNFIRRRREGPPRSREKTNESHGNLISL